MRAENATKNVHVNLSLTINEDNWGYHQPRVDKSISFSIPVVLFSAKLLADMIEAEFKGAITEFPKAVEAFEEEERAKAEREAAVKVEEKVEG